MTSLSVPSPPMQATASKAAAISLAKSTASPCLAVKNRLEAAERKRQEYEAERARQKAEREAKEKAETEKLIQAGKKEEAAPEQKPVPQEVPKTAVEQKTVPEEEPVCALDFRVYVTKSQMEKLKKFLNDSGIRFEPVPRQ